MPDIVKGRRYRYIHFILSSTDKIYPGHLIQTIKQQSLKCSSTLTPVSFRLISFDGTTGILRCLLPDTKHFLGLLQSLGYVQTQKVQIKTKAVSGTLRGLQKKKKGTKENKEKKVL